ncbi:MAG: hypothetical protein ACPGYT_09425 [Nitrospirales bacterium]
MSLTKSNTPLIIIDAHVHIHGCFDLPTFFESALTNCRIHATDQQHQGPLLGVLLLAESSWDHWFQRLGTFADQHKTLSSDDSQSWNLHRTSEDFTLVAQSRQGSKLLIVAGRQIVTQEKFEVLALMTSQTFQDGLSIQESIEHVKRSGGIPVIPWAFGKWWGARGKRLTELMNSTVMSDVFLGDNSGRPGFLPYPSQFTLAETQGIRIFPGSDPLPMAWETFRPCSVGLSLMSELEEACPGSCLKHILQNAQATMTPYFQHESVYRFFKNQIAMKMMKPRQAAT